MYTKTPSSLKVAKRYLTNIYKEYYDCQIVSFDEMVVKFSQDDFYKAYLVAKYYLLETSKVIDK